MDAQPGLMTDQSDVTKQRRFDTIYNFALTSVGLTSIGGVFFINRLHSQPSGNANFRMYYRYLGVTACALLFFTWAEMRRVSLDKEMCVKYFSHAHDLEAIRAIGERK